MAVGQASSNSRRYSYGRGVRLALTVLFVVWLSISIYGFVARDSRLLLLAIVMLLVMMLLSQRTSRIDWRNSLRYIGPFAFLVLVAALFLVDIVVVVLFVGGLEGWPLAAKEVLGVSVDDSTMVVCATKTLFTGVHWEQLASKLVKLRGASAVLGTESVDGRVVVILGAANETIYLCPLAPCKQDLDRILSYNLTSIISQELSVKLKEITHIQAPVLNNNTPIESLQIIGVDPYNRTVKVRAEITLIPPQLIRLGLPVTLAAYTMITALLYVVMRAKKVCGLVPRGLVVLEEHKIMFLVSPYILFTILHALMAVALAVYDVIVYIISQVVALAVSPLIGLVIIAAIVADIVPRLKTEELAFLMLSAGFIILLLGLIVSVLGAWALVRASMYMVYVAYIAGPLKSVLTASVPFLITALEPLFRSRGRPPGGLHHRSVLVVFYAVLSVLIFTLLLNWVHAIYSAVGPYNIALTYDVLEFGLVLLAMLFMVPLSLSVTLTESVKGKCRAIIVLIIGVVGVIALEHVLTHRVGLAVFVVLNLVYPLFVMLLMGSELRQIVLCLARQLRQRLSRLVWRKGPELVFAEADFSC